MHSDVERVRRAADGGRVLGALVVSVLVVRRVDALIGLVRAARRSGVRFGDFSAFHTAWVLSSERNGAALYSPERFRDRLGAVTSLDWLPQQFPLFVNPPFVAVAGSPLGRLTINDAFVVWLIVNLGAILLFGGWVWRHLVNVGRGPGVPPLRPAADAVLLLGAVLVWPPTLQALRLGAFTLVLCLALAGLVWSVEGSGPVRTAIGGLCVVALAAKPQHALLVIVALVVVRAWRVLAAASAAGSVVAVASTVWLGLAPWTGWLRLLVRYSGDDGQYGLDVSSMINLRGAVMRSAGPAAAAVAATVALPVGLAVIVSMSRRVGAGTAVATAAAIGVLTVPHVNGQDLLLAAPLLVLAVTRSGWAAVLAGLAWAIPTMFGPLLDAGALTAAAVLSVVAAAFTVSDGPIHVSGPTDGAPTLRAAVGVSASSSRS